MRRGPILAALSLALAVLAGCGGGSPASSPDGPYRGSEPPGRIALPDFALRDVSGRVVAASDLRGRVALVTFLDSQCTESCPVIAWQVARAIDALEPEERRQVVALAITTDPTEDTRESVLGFLRRNRAVGRIRWVGGGEPVRRLRAVWRSFQVLSSLESGEDEVHSAPVRIYDRKGVWVATLHAGADLTTENLLHDLRLAIARS